MYGEKFVQLYRRIIIPMYIVEVNFSRKRLSVIFVNLFPTETAKINFIYSTNARPALFHLHYFSLIIICKRCSWNREKCQSLELCWRMHNTWLNVWRPYKKIVFFFCLFLLNVTLKWHNAFSIVAGRRSTFKTKTEKIK